MCLCAFFFLNLIFPVFLPLSVLSLFLTIHPSMSSSCLSLTVSLCLCLTQTSRRSSHRCERSTIREQYHALECCYFWVSHALNPTPPCCLCCATVLVMHRFSPHTATAQFSMFPCIIKTFLITVPIVAWSSLENQHVEIQRVFDGRKG